MSITTRSELLAAVTNYYEGRTDIGAYAAEFIELSEGLFNTDLRCREMEAVTDLTPSSNVCTLPTDYIEWKRVVEKASIRRPLKFITAEGADHLYPTRPAGLACHFTIIGNDLTALPLSTNDIELTYYQKIPALTEANTTNWLLARLPNLYLHACLMYAAEFVKNDAEIAKEGTIVDRYISMLSGMDTRSKYANAGVTLTGYVP